MKYYFFLQFSIFKRYIKDSGIPVAVGILLRTMMYVFLFILAGQHRESLWVSCVLIAFGTSILTYLSEKNRNEFLKAIFSKPNYLAIRGIENYVSTIPIFCIAVYARNIGVMIYLLIIPALLNPLKSDFFLYFRSLNF